MKSFFLSRNIVLGISLFFVIILAICACYLSYLYGKEDGILQAYSEIPGITFTR